MKLLLKSFLLAILLTSSSCAYMMNKKTVEVAINSIPSGADIFIEGSNYGKTPRVLTLEPKKHVLVLTKEGYGSTKLELESWQAIRSAKGEGGRCLADALGTMFILPYFSFMSIYCRDFKKPEYTASIPYVGGTKGNVQNPAFNRGRNPTDMIDYYYKEDGVNNNSSSNSNVKPHPYGSYYPPVKDEGNDRMIGYERPQGQ